MRDKMGSLLQWEMEFLFDVESFDQMIGHDEKLAKSGTNFDPKDFYPH